MKFWILAIFLVGLIVVIQVNGKGGRGGGRSGGRVVVEWRGSRSSYGGRTNSIKSTSTLKKAAVIGAGVYAGYKLNKAKNKFKTKKPKFSIDLDIEDDDDDQLFSRWDSWRAADGFMCRNNNDCNWLDVDLRCEDYEVSVLNTVRQTINQDWFGGQALSVVGECHCQRIGQVWDRQELECSGAEYKLAGLTLLILSLAVNFL
eukprot:GFUD01008914.1.p1 GENE.GFUD01008914.1~~GFUD01008914.1.p1  ORF type:complete len:202 (+),score=38.85 GFUD01008914.1:64-669(+)